MTQDIAIKEGHADHRRKVRFDWSDTPLHWVPNDPFATHLINVLHLLLPAGERWFIQVVDEASAYLTDDPELQRAIQPFLQQEAWHARAHRAVLQHLAEHGLDTEPYTQRLKSMFDKLGDAKPHWPAPLRRWWLLRWHGAEEIEHRSLVFDVYQNLSGSYPLRAASC